MNDEAAAYLARKQAARAAPAAAAPGLSGDDAAEYLAKKQAERQARQGRIDAGMSPMPTFLDKLKEALGGDSGPPPKSLVERNEEMGPSTMEKILGRGGQFIDKLRGVPSDERYSPEGLHRRRMDIIRSNPKFLEEQENLRGMAAGALTGTMAAQALGAAAPLFKGGGQVAQTASRVLPAAAGAGAGTAVDDLTTQTASPQRRVENALQGSIVGGLLSELLGGTGRNAGETANRIENSNTQTGDDIRALKKMGAEPSPMPFRPVTNSPAAQMGVRPNPRGRAMVAEQGARQLFEEKGARMGDARKAMGAGQEQAYASEGGRSVSTNDLVSQVDAYLGSNEAKLNPSVAAAMENVKKVLTGEVEPSFDIYPAEPTKVQGGAGAVEEKLDRPIEIYPTEARKVQGSAGAVEEKLDRPIEIYNSTPTEVRTGPAAVFSKRPGNGVGGNRESVVAPRSRFLAEGDLPNQVEGRAVSVDTGEPTVISSTERPGFKSEATSVDVGEPIVISSTERPGFQSEATSVGGREPMRVPTGDVHGRVGDAPNYVLPVKHLDQLRDKLDDLAGYASRETGIPKQKLPFGRLGNSIRAKLAPDDVAPQVTAANSAYADEMRTQKNLKALMKSKDPEGLGMQISSLNQPGAQISGTRQNRLGRLQREFPESERLPREEIDKVFDRPRAIQAEERMHLKKLPRIGGGDDVLNLAEPLLARGVYGPLRSLERAAAHSPGAAALLAQLLTGKLRLPEPGGERR